MLLVLLDLHLQIIKRILNPPDTFSGNIEFDLVVLLGLGQVQDLVFLQFDDIDIIRDDIRVIILDLRIFLDMLELDPFDVVVFLLLDGLGVEFSLLLHVHPQLVHFLLVLFFDLVEDAFVFYGNGEGSSETITHLDGWQSAS